MTEPAPSIPAARATWRGSVRRLFVPLLRLRVWLTERGPQEFFESAYFSAALVGLCAAVTSVAFREALSHLEYLFLRYRGPLEGAATTLPWWARILVPTAGGLVAGMILILARRWKDMRLDFMEVVVLGNGIMRVRATLVKSLSSLITISTGGSIGREGSMVQLGAMSGSLIGRVAKFGPARLRLMVACGAAAGIACAYNAPFSGAFFVAEIVLGSIALESFGPLVFASVMATVVSTQFLGSQPVYHMPAFGAVPNWQLPLHAILGVVAGLLAPLFLILLRGSEGFFRWLKAPLVLSLGLGGLIVGLISTVQPGVWGNGYGMVEAILNMDLGWKFVFALLVLKVLATMATTGSGAVGGVFTPTLFCGAAIGALFAHGLHALLPHASISTGSYAVVGMGCFLAATTRAPIMSILIMFEMTRNDAAIMPLMLACVSSFLIARQLQRDSVYSRQLQGALNQADTPLFLLHVRDLMKRDPIHVTETAGFEEIAGVLASHTFKHLYVVDHERRFLGAIALQDLKPFLQEKDMPRMVIALDLMHDDMPVLTGDSSLKESLEVFSRHDGERLPVLDNPTDRRLLGALAKTDVLLTLAHGMGTAGRDAGSG
jgi:CIC family chloride channel protein